MAKEAASLSSNIQEVEDWRDILIEELKVTPEVLGNAERSVAELAYANVLQKHAYIDNWFDLHVIMIPCVYVSCICPAHTVRWLAYLERGGRSMQRWLMIILKREKVTIALD